MEIFDHIFHNLFESNDGEKNISTGLRTLDKLIDGGFGSELIVVSGRPNHGKTTMLLNLLLNFSYFQEYKGMIVAPRSNQKSMIKRLISIIEDSEQPMDNWNETILLDRISDTKRLLSKKVLVDYHFENLDVIVTKAKDWKASYLIIDDFLSIVQHAFLGTKDYLILIEKLNSFIKETKIPVFISILARSSVEKRGGNQSPLISDIFKSDLLLPLVNKVFLVYRESEYGITIGRDGESTENKIEISLAVNSLGRIGSLELKIETSGKIK